MTVDATSAPPPPSNPTTQGLSVPLAGFASRAMALAIDLALLGLVGLGLMFFTGRLLWGTMPLTPAAFLRLALAVSAWLLTGAPLFHLAYFTVLHGHGGQTIGKLLMGLRVTGMDNQEITLGRAFLRTAASLASALPLAAGFLWAAVDQEHRTWHDHIAGTRVIID